LQADLFQQLTIDRATPATIASWQGQFGQIESDLADRLLALPDDHTAHTQRINLARSRILVPQPQWEIATKLLQRTIDRAPKQSSVFAEATGTLGWLHERKGKWEPARKLTTAAIALDRDRPYQWEWQLGRIFQHQNQPDLDRAGAAYDRAIAALENTRRQMQIANTDAQFSLRDRVDTLYREAIDLGLQARQPNLARIVTRIDALKLAELENFLQCQIGRYRSIGRFATDTGAIVFYPIVLADRLEVILGLGKERFARYSVPVSRRQLEATIDRFRTSLNQPQYGWQDAAAAQLYDWLLRPAEPYLPTAKQLVFVMDGTLQNIPVAALYDRMTRQYAIERYPIAITPGLEILGAKPASDNRSTILIGGLTADTSTFTRSTRRYEPLVNAAAEVRTIKSLFDRSTQLTGKDFNQTEIDRHLTNNSISILHLSTHGRFSSDPRQTFIAMADGRYLDLDRLRTILTRQRTQPLDLLVLSACETATGDRRAALGLSGTALRSGAASTLASLWSVDDRATAMLMQEFYRSLARPGTTKAQALRTAQITVRQQYAHPYYWSAFVLVGNWL
jgi:CHAT domain-containing protein